MRNDFTPLQHAADSDSLSNKFRRRRYDDELDVQHQSRIMSNFEERLLHAQNKTMRKPIDNVKGRLSKTQRNAFFNTERPLGGTASKIKLQMPKKSKKKRMPTLFGQILKQPTYDKKRHEELLLEEKAATKKKAQEDEEKRKLGPRSTDIDDWYLAD